MIMHKDLHLLKMLFRSSNIWNFTYSLHMFTCIVFIRKTIPRMKCTISRAILNSGWTTYRKQNKKKKANNTIPFELLAIDIETKAVNACYNKQNYRVNTKKKGFFSKQAQHPQSVTLDSNPAQSRVRSKLCYANLYIFSSKNKTK